MRALSGAQCARTGQCTYPSGTKYQFCGISGQEPNLLYYCCPTMKTDSYGIEKPAQCNPRNVKSCEFAPSPANTGSMLIGILVPVVIIGVIAAACFGMRRKQQQGQMMQMQNGVPMAQPVGGPNNPGGYGGGYGQQQRPGMSTGAAVGAGVAGGLLGGWALGNMFDGNDYGGGGFDGGGGGDFAADVGM